MRPGTVDRLAVLFTSQHDDPELAWFAHACFERSRAYLPGPHDGFTDLRRPYRGPPPKTGRWELLPLDPKFAATEAPGFPHAHTTSPENPHRSGSRQGFRYPCVAAGRPRSGS